MLANLKELKFKLMSARSVTVVVVITLLSLFTSEGVLAQSGKKLKPRVSKAVKFDVSPPLRSIRPVLTSEDSDKGEDDRGNPGPVNDTKHDPDPVVQRWSGYGIFSQNRLIPPTSVSFAGMTGTVQPPDTVGDVSVLYYVQMVNSRFQVFNKIGTSLFGPVNINTLWSGFGGACQTENAGDPVVLHDQMADRWLITQFTSAGPTYFNCVALSTSSDPTGTYYRWAFTTGTNFPDYPKYGVWSDGYYISTREFAGAAFAGVGAYALNRDQMILGNPSPQVVSFLLPPGAQPYRTGDGLLPADLDGTTLPPVGSPQYYVGSMDSGGPYGAPTDALNLFKFSVNWTTPGSSTFTFSNQLNTADFDSIFPCTPTSRNCIPQPGTTNKIDILSYRQRPMHRLAYRNFGTHESLVTNQSVEATTGIAGIRWWEIRSPNSSPVIHQEGTYSPDNVNRWMGSIAMDRVGNMLLGYSVSDAASVSPGIRITGRMAADPLGTLPQGEGTIVAGAGALTTGNRWGDYSAMVVDPADNCTFWYTTEYTNAVSATTWVSRISSVRFPGCVAPAASYDFEGDGKTDVSIFRPSNGQWWIQQSSDNVTKVFTFGTTTDKIVPADYDGDGKTDVAFFRPSTSEWFVLRSSNLTFFSAPFGATNDIAAPGDFDGDSKADLAVYRQSAGTWFINRSTGGTSIVPFGISQDLPVVADYDGDAKADVAVFRPTGGSGGGEWWILRSTGGVFATPFGSATDKPVQADYTGDGKADVAFYRPSTSDWFVLRSENLTFYSAPFGSAGDVPVAGDYDGDAKTDLAVFRPTNTTWFILKSTGGTTIQPFGTTGDKAVPSAFVP